MVSVRAPAKINLALRVLAREEDGFHQLETIFTLLDLHDSLELHHADRGITLEIEGAGLGPPEENLVWRAAEAFLTASRIGAGVRARLVKRIPAGAGLGGGSSDAAATLLGLNRMHGEPLSPARLLGIGAGIGSDVPFFLSGASLALAWGRGGRLLRLRPLPERPALIVVPAFSISTANAFAAIVPPDPLRPSVLEVDRLESWEGLAGIARNDFEDAVFDAHPELGAVRDRLGAAGAAPALLTGTGSAVFGVFADAAARDRCAATLEAAAELTVLRATACAPPPTS